jgi:two-component system, cell cycle sensor histidine kinase and response regulator CckA
MTDTASDPTPLHEWKDGPDSAGGDPVEAEPGGRYRRLVEEMRGVVFYEHGPDNRFTYLSPSAREVYGFAPEELVGRSFEVLHPGDDTDETVRELTQLAFREGRAPGAYTAINRRKDGRIIYVEIVETPIVRDGKVVSVHGVARDVTDQVRARRTLAQAEARVRDRERMDAVGRLAGGIAHEFNNLLTAMVGNVEFLVERQRDPEGAVVPEAEAMGELVDRARLLTRRLLEFSRHQVIRPEILDLDESTREREGLLRRFAGPGVVLTRTVEDKPWPVCFDPGQLEQILVNLVLNACDAMPSGGTVRIGIRNVHVSPGDAPDELLPGRYVELSVKDNGPGIPEELLDRVLEPFFTTKDPTRASGLGLSTVYGILRQAGGGLRLRGEAGEGAEVLVYLPVVEGTPARDGAVASGERGAAPGPAPVADSDGVILVVIGRPELRRELVRILLAGGHRVLEAGDAREGLEIAEEVGAGLRLAVVSLSLPDRKGLTVARRLQVGSPRLPVLLTGERREEAAAADHLLQQGLPFIPTPILPGELLRRVEEELRRSLDSAGSPTGSLP